MAKRFTDTEIWDKEWFMNLSPRLKCLVSFVRDKCDLSGVWSPNLPLAQMYIEKGGEVFKEAELLQIDGGRQFVKLSSGKIFCLGFIEFQNGSLSSKSPVHRKILGLLDTHKIPYPYPINSGQVEVEVKEEVIVEGEVKVEVKEGVQGEPSNESINDQFERFFTTYDKNVGKNACRYEWCRLSKEARELIMIHVVKYVASTPDKAFRKNPETYLIEETWKDEIIVKIKNGKTKSTLEGVAKHIANNNA